jgi:hypothetical protein
MWLIAEPAVNGVCKECGSEEHSYSYSRCARCYVRKLLTEILTDPATGRVLSGMAPRATPDQPRPLPRAVPDGPSPQLPARLLDRSAPALYAGDRAQPT